MGGLITNDFGLWVKHMRGVLVNMANKSFEKMIPTKTTFTGKRILNPKHFGFRFFRTQEQMEDLITNDLDWVFFIKPVAKRAKQNKKKLIPKQFGFRIFLKTDEKSVTKLNPEHFGICCISRKRFIFPLTKMSPLLCLPRDCVWNNVYSIHIHCSSSTFW